MDLEGRVAVVTGAASGIGAGLARALSGAGMRLVLADVEIEPARALARELAGGGREAIAVRTDVTRAEEVEALAERAFAELGGVHVLCNNAGVCQGGPLYEMTPDDWRWILAVNLGGVIHGCRSFVPRLIAQGEPAHVMNTASVGGFLSGGTLGMYSTSKFAVVAYSEALAQELAAHRIAVSALCPGWVDTRLADAARNRPESLGSAPPGMEAIVPGMAAGMDPDTVGRHALRGIREDAAYVFTHPEFEPLIAQRFERVLDALRRSKTDPG